MLYAVAPLLARQPYRVGVACDLRDHRRRRPRDPRSRCAQLVPARPGLAAQAPAARARRRPRCCSRYFRLRTRALSPAIAEARLQALQARIRPHFLFNSMNGVLSLVRRDPERAEEALHDMADLFRVLMRDNRELAPLADEVELCRAVPRAREAAARRAARRRLERQEHARRRARAAAGAAADLRERRLPRHRAVEPSRARSR